MDLRHCGNAIGGDLKVSGGLANFRRPALHRQQARHELKAVHHPVVDLLGHQIRLADRTAGRESELELIHHHRGEVLQVLDLLLLDRAGFLVYHAQSAQVVTVAGRQRNRRIKAQAEVSGDERVGQRTGVGSGILDQIRRIAQNGRRAQSGFAVYLLHGQAMVRLEPDAVFVNDADNGDRNSEPASGQRRDAVERAVGRTVENVVTPNRGYALSLVGRKNGGDSHEL